MIRYRARWILPISRPPIADGVVAVDNGRIAFAGPHADAPAGGELVDLGDVALLPGLVNVHTHLELTAMRGFLEDLAFRDWIVTLTSAKRAVLTHDMLLDSARLGIREGLSAGITTFADTSDSGVSAEAMREARVRGIVYQEVFGPDPAQCENAMAELEGKVEMLRAEASPLVRIGISPHAPYTVSDVLFRATACYARRARLPVAVHIAESAIEHDLITRGEGVFAQGLRARGIAVAARARSPVALLADTGILESSPLLIHCVRVDDNDVQQIVAAGCAIAHCPISNAKLGHGIAPLAEWLAAGITVGLGSDSMASNNRMDLLQEARVASLAQRARLQRFDTLTATTVLELATLGGARALHLDDEIGSLEPGKSADLAAFSLIGDRPSYPEDPATALVFALAGMSASFVAIAGEVKVRDGQVLAGDAGLEARVRSASEALAQWRNGARP